MRIPERLIPLVDTGVLQDVLRPLMSGKEAAVYLVEAQDELRVAKVYKEAHERSFHQRSDYTEGRKVKNSREQRAMDKRSRYGRERMEAAWHSAEVDAIYRLRAAGVRVPEPFDFVDGVLVMELVRGADGGPAPRLVDVDLEHDEALALMKVLLREVVKMLCAGLVHGDLSDFNVLIGPDGPVIIDFPQWVDPSHNRNARKLLIRDVDNLTQFLSRFAPELSKTKYGPEMWDLYERGELSPDTQLTGRWTPPSRHADVNSVLDEIQAAVWEERRRRGESVPSEPQPILPRELRPQPRAPQQGPKGQAPRGEQGQRPQGQRPPQQQQGQRSAQGQGQGQGQRPQGQGQGQPQGQRPQGQPQGQRPAQTARPTQEQTGPGQRAQHRPAQVPSGRDQGQEQGRDQGREQGRDQGRDQGREQGRDQGREQGRNQAYPQRPPPPQRPPQPPSPPSPPAVKPDLDLDELDVDSPAPHRRRRRPRNRGA